MKNAKTIVTLLTVVIFASIAAGYAAGFFVYKEYQEKTRHLEEETRNSFRAMENSIKGLSIALEDTADQNRQERKEFLTRIEDMREGIKEWEATYKIALSELKGQVRSLKVNRLTRMVENLQSDIEEFKIKIQDMKLKEDIEGVDLGKISVKK